MAEYDANGDLIPGTTKKPVDWSGTVNNTEGYAVEIKGTNGPLKDLYVNPYSQKALYYPRDLGRLDKGHSIQLDIRDVVPGGPAITKVIGDVFEYGRNANFSSVNQATKELTGVTEKFTQALESAYKNTNFTSIIDLKPETTKVIASVRLYMPDSLVFNYDAQYDKLSVSEAINSIPLVGEVTKAITSTVSEREIGRAISNKLGYTFNPQQQTLFEGIDFREFQLDFTFTPTSQEEAATVQEIIKTLRIAAAPTKVKSAGGFFFIPPSIFNISFFFNDSINYSIPPIRPCVLQNISTNFAPNGWAAMRDGSPAQTTISLSFKELDLVDRDNIKQETTMAGA